MSEKGGTPVRRRRLELECLEERIAPVGNVIVSVSGGNLTLTGDAEANEFMIDHSGLGLSELRITPGGGTTLNGGASEVIVSGVQGIKMTLGDGDDRAVLNDITLAKNVVVDTGGGDNSLVVTGTTAIGGALTVKSSAAWSQDRLEINGSDVLGNVSLSTKGGGQTVFVGSSEIGGNLSMKIGDLNGEGDYRIISSDIAGKVNLAIAKGYHVLGGDPEDSIPFSIVSSQVGSVAVQAKAGDYSFQFISSETNKARKGGISVSYGSGDSYTIIGGSTIYGSVSVKTGTKYSWLDQLLNVAWDTEFTLAESTIAGKLAIGNLDSDDTITMQVSHIFRGATISNGTGDATVNFSYVGMHQEGGKAYPLKITSGTGGWGFEDDTVSVLLDEVTASTLTVSAPQKSDFFIHDLNASSASVTTGGYNDTLYFANVDTSGNLSIKTGAGDDTVSVTEHNTPHGTLTLDTGAGNDTVGLDAESYDDVSDYYGNVKVILGTGDDQLRVGQGGIDGNFGRYWKAAIFDGGQGTDSINYISNGNSFTLPPVVTNFETVS